MKEFVDYQQSESELEEMFATLDPQLILEEIQEQIDDPFNATKTDFVDYYVDKYKAIKKTLNDEDLVEALKQQRNEAMELVLISIENRFKFSIDREDVSINQAAKALYDFFILNYNENMEKFIINYIVKNKKQIVSELKRTKGKRDVSTITSKMLYNANDAIILNNVNNIVLNILSSLELESDFIQYITTDRDLHVNRYIYNLFVNNSETIDFEENLYNVFFEPLFKQDDGFINVVSTVTTELYQLYKTDKSIDII